MQYGSLAPRVPDLADEIFGSLQSKSVFLGLDGSQLFFRENTETKTVEEPMLLEKPIPRGPAAEASTSPQKPLDNFEAPVERKSTALGFVVTPLKEPLPTTPTPVIPSYDDRPVGGKKPFPVSEFAPSAAINYDERPVGSLPKKAGSLDSVGSPSSHGPGPSKATKGVKMII